MSHINRLPVLFIGHGSPMNAIADNDYTKSLKKLGQELKQKYKPDAILMISAHWETMGTYFTNDERPQQIYDMSGFPEELYKLEYKPAGFPKMFKSTDFPEIQPSHFLGSRKWGLDHGAWSVLTHLFPHADIPVVQLSLDVKKSLPEHFEIAKKISVLADQNILIIGSGNIVHNLRNFSWDSDAPIMAWSQHFDQWIHQKTVALKYAEIVSTWAEQDYALKAVPTPEHFLPFIYCLGISQKFALKPHVIYDGIQNGSMAMRSYLFL